MLTVDQLIEYLQAFQKRKGMYVQPVTVKTVEAFLAGFRTGCHAFGIEINGELELAAQEPRGWKPRAVSPIPQMEAKGMSDAEIMDELIEIEMDVLRAQVSRDT